MIDWFDENQYNLMMIILELEELKNDWKDDGYTKEKVRLSVTIADLYSAIENLDTVKEKVRKDLEEKERKAAENPRHICLDGG